VPTSAETQSVFGVLCATDDDMHCNILGENFKKTSRDRIKKTSLIIEINRKRYAIF
jgi:hypothetical protein